MAPGPHGAPPDVLHFPGDRSTLKGGMHPSSCLALFVPSSPSCGSPFLEALVED